MREVSALRTEVWRDGQRAEGIAEGEDGEEFYFCVAERCGGCAAGTEVEEGAVVMFDVEDGEEGEEEGEEGEDGLGGGVG